MNFRNEGSQLVFVLLSRAELLNEINFKLVAKVGVRRTDLVALVRGADGEKPESSETGCATPDLDAVEAAPTENPAATAASSSSSSKPIDRPQKMVSQSADPAGYKPLTYYQFGLVLRRMQTEAEVALQIQLAQRYFIAHNS